MRTAAQPSTAVPKSLHSLFRQCRLLTGAMLLSWPLMIANAAPFTAGNAVIYRIGNGTDPLVNTGNPVFLDEYSPAGALVQSIALPATANGAQKQLIASGTSTSEGMMTRSANGAFLVLTGYGTDTGGASSLSGTASTAVPRTIGRVDALGNVDTSTSLTDYAPANNPRSATSVDGTGFWACGGAGGLRHATLGATTSTQLSTTVVNLRQPSVFGGQLYVSTSSGSAVRIGRVGTGTPTTEGQVITNLPDFPLTGSPFAYFPADLNAAAPGFDTLYVADDTSGIQKWSLVAGSWTANGAAGTAAEAYRGLTGSVSGGTVTLFAVRRGGSTATGGGELVMLTDATGHNATLAGTPSLVATAAANTAYRGVAFAPRVAPDLTVKAAAPASAEVGAPFTYTLTAANGGGDDATGVEVKFTLPAGVSYSAAAAEGFTIAEAAGVVTFSGGALAAGTSKELTVVVTPDAPGTFTLPGWAAVIDQANTIVEADEANNNSPDPVTTLASLTPDLTASLTGPSQAVKDVPFDYTITVSNGGLGDAADVKVQFTLPAGLTYNSAGGTGFTAAEASGVVTFSGGSIAAKTDAVLTVSVTGSPASPTAITAPAGAVVADPDNTLDEISEANNASTAAVTTQVRIFGLPSAAGDAYDTITNESLTVAAPAGVLTNDPESARTVVSASKPAHGNVTVNPDGSFTYVPDEGFAGTDTFTYTVTDAVRLYRHTLPPLGTFGGALISGDGFGSALVPVPGTTDEYYGLTDRGPNVDGLTDTAKVFPIPDFTPAIRRFKLIGREAVPQGDPILLKTPDGTPYSGRFNTANPGLDEGYDINGNLLPTDVNGFDSEGFVALADGTFWISDEYGPFITHFDANGLELKRLSPFDGSLPVELAKRRSNRGMEGLAITPDGTMLVGMLQSALEQPDNLEQPGDIPVDPTKVAPVRIVTYTIATGEVRQYLYMLENPNTNNKVVTSEITALSNTTFLVDERDNGFPPSAFKKVFLIDLTGATDVGPLSTVSGSTYESTGDQRGLLLAGKSIEATVALQSTADATTTLAAAGITPVSKTLDFDLGAMLLSLNPEGKFFAHDKIEGLCFADSGNTLLIANDSDFGIDALSNAAPPFTFRTKVAPPTPAARDIGEIIAVDRNRLPAAKASATVTVSIAPAADIAVLNGPLATSPALADGQAAPVAFGNTKLLRTTTRTFTVKNSGSAPLTGIAVELDGANAANFVLMTTPATSLAAGETTAFDVKFTPPALGSFTANLRVRSNDAAEDPFDLVLTAAGVSNADLVTLTVAPDALKPVFNPDTITYFSSYTNETTSVTFTPTLMDPNAKLEVRFGGSGSFTAATSGAATAAFALNPGNNRAEFRVTAVDGTTVNTYAVTVNRAPVVFNSTVRDVMLPNTRAWSSEGVVLGGTRFVNLGLQGIGRVPASTIDPATGESLGSISDMQISNFTNNGDGTWSGDLTTLPDRGFNTTIVNPEPQPPTNIFSNYAARLNEFTFTFTPYTGAAAITAQNQIALTFAGSTRFTYDHDGDPVTDPVYSTGLLADGMAEVFGTTVPAAAGETTQSDGTVENRLTLDTEGLVLDTRPGKAGSGWIGDEYGAYIYHFNSAKEIDGVVPLPEALIPHAPAGEINFFADPPVNGRRINQGMEGLCQSPDGTKLFGMLQSATLQDSGSGNQGRTTTRLLVFDVTGGDLPATPAQQFVIQLPRFDSDAVAGLDRAGAQSSIIALNNHQLLILSRDGNGRGAVGAPVFKSILLADLTGATDFNGTFDGEGAAGDLTSSGDTLKAGITPLTWTEALNMIGALGVGTSPEITKFGLNLDTAPGNENSLCEKWEALSLVPVNDPANPNDYFLFIGNDNDFLTATGKLTDAHGDLQSYVGAVENDTMILAYRVRLEDTPDVRVYNGPDASAPFVADAGPAADVGPTGTGTTLTRTFTIENSGHALLTLGNPAVVTGGTHAADFKLTAVPGDTTLAPGESTTFTIEFTPSAAGVRQATVQITSDAPGATASYDFALRGTGNTAPVAPPQSFVRGAGFSLKIAKEVILAACSDPDGDALTVSGLGTSAQGAVLTQTATHILYSPPDSDADDTFTYTISDGKTGTATGTITIQTVAQAGLTTGATAGPGGVMTAHFAGIPGFTYVIERSTDLVLWIPVQTITAPANGQFSYEDNDNLPSAFYRLRYEP